MCTVLCFYFLCDILGFFKAGCIQSGAIRPITEKKPSKMFTISEYYKPCLCVIPSLYFSSLKQPNDCFIHSLTLITNTLRRRLAVILCQWSHGFGPQEWIEMDPHVSLYV